MLCAVHAAGLFSSSGQKRPVLGERLISAGAGLVDLGVPESPGSFAVGVALLQVRKPNHAQSPRALWAAY